MQAPSVALAAWWSLVDANRVALTVVVIAVVIAALGFVGVRLWNRRR